MNRQCVYYGWELDLKKRNDRNMRNWTDNYFSRPVDVEYFDIDHILAREQELETPTYLRQLGAL